MTKIRFTPKNQGLYDSQYEHDACGIGFVVNLKGTQSHEIVHQGLTILMNLDHRGARGSEVNTGDGAGILMQIPHKFFVKECANTEIKLPTAGEYAVGMVFLPPIPSLRAECEKIFTQIIHEEGQTLLGWRTLPTSDVTLGNSAKDCKPYIRQVFIAKNPELKDDWLLNVNYISFGNGLKKQFDTPVKMVMNSFMWPAFPAALLFIKEC